MWCASIFGYQGRAAGGGCGAGDEDYFCDQRCAGRARNRVGFGAYVPDPTTVEDVERIVRKYGLLGELPVSLRGMIERRELRETPKDGDAAFARARFEILLGEHDLLHAAHHCCEAEGFLCMVDTETDDWPLEKAAEHLLRQLEI